MGYLLDTNHCSQIIMQNSALLDELLLRQQEELFTSSIVQGELIDMVARSQQKAVNLRLVRQFLANIQVYSVTTEIADVYGNLKARIFDQFAPKDKTERRRFKNLKTSDSSDCSKLGKPKPNRPPITTSPLTNALRFWSSKNTDAGSTNASDDGSNKLIFLAPSPWTRSISPSQGACARPTSSNSRRAIGSSNISA
jgi:predicted nucleic acid-binding protein